MAKQLYYYCEDCLESWIEDYEKEYGECDSECSLCGSDISPYTKKSEWNKAIKQRESKLTRVFVTIEVITTKNDIETLKHTLAPELEKVLENMDDTGLTGKLSKIIIE